MQVVSTSLIGQEGSGMTDSYGDEGMIGFDNTLTSTSSGADDDWKSSWK